MFEKFTFLETEEEWVKLLREHIKKVGGVPSLQRNENFIKLMFIKKSYNDQNLFTTELIEVLSKEKRLHYCKKFKENQQQNIITNSNT